MEPVPTKEHFWHGDHFAICRVTCRARRTQAAQRARTERFKLNSAVGAGSRRLDEFANLPVMPLMKQEPCGMRHWEGQTNGAKVNSCIYSCDILQQTIKIEAYLITLLSWRNFGMIRFRTSDKDFRNCCFRQRLAEVLREELKAHQIEPVSFHVTAGETGNLLNIWLCDLYDASSQLFRSFYLLFLYKIYKVKSGHVRVWVIHLLSDRARLRSLQRPSGDGFASGCGVYSEESAGDDR